MDNEEFGRQTDLVLSCIRKRTYAETLDAIDRLELDAARDLGWHGVAVSCADLRLDAALATSQPFEECERRYNGLVSLGIDAQMELLKTVVFAKEADSPKREIVRAYLTAAVARGRDHGAPQSLVDVAEKLLVTMS
jgi:hypothetical protein